MRDKAIVIALLAALAACGPDLGPRLEQLEEENRMLKEMAGPLPSSLDDYYPPKAKAPVYMLEMFALATPLEGIGTDLQESDMVGVTDNFNAFRTQYQKMAGMVGEWADKFPMEPLDSLEQALEKGNFEGIGMAMAQIGDVCKSCHVISQTKAYHKYHWPDFDLLSLTDPLTGRELSWNEFMMSMSGAFSAIGTSLNQGQQENAQAYYVAFRQQFTSMTEGCFGCHDTPRAAFTDERVQDMIKELGVALDASTPDLGNIETLRMAIGNEGCLKCHYVHLPPVLAKLQWKNYSDIFQQP